MRKKEVKKIIQSEINWSKEHHAVDYGISEDFKKGFIAGLRQAKRLISELPDFGERRVV